MLDNNYENFITDMMRFASSADTPDVIINQILQYICENLHCDRAYIFEDNHDGTFDNTYEYCSEGVTAEIDNLKNVPYEGMLDEWFKEYEKSHNILIYDIEEYRKVSESLYNLLKPQGIKTLVTGPIEINGVKIGFYGVDNPPVEIMEKASKLIDFMEFIMDMMIRIRDYTKAIEYSSVTDLLTDYKNRRALEWAYEDKFEGSSSVTAVMCDLNGLKAINDTEGHKAGDQYLVRAAGVLGEVFGKDNVYRVGGDEFVVVLLDKTLAEVEEIFDIFDRKCAENKVSCSYGYEYNDSANKNFEAMLAAADSKMYDAKRDYYERNGIERRGTR